jgi:hypothetical protein
MSLANFRLTCGERKCEVILVQLIAPTLQASDVRAYAKCPLCGEPLKLVGQGPSSELEVIWRDGELPRLKPHVHIDVTDY